VTTYPGYASEHFNDTGRAGLDSSRFPTLYKAIIFHQDHDFHCTETSHIPKDAWVKRRAVRKNHCPSAAVQPFLLQELWLTQQPPLLLLCLCCCSSLCSTKQSKMCPETQPGDTSYLYKQRLCVYPASEVWSIPGGRHCA
jgi:hypothetical protein